MRGLVVFAAVLAIGFALQAPRAGDADPANRKYWLIPDETGKVHLVNTEYTPRIIDPIDGKNVTFYVYTPANKDVGVAVHADELDVLIESGIFDPSLPTLFTTHGWGGSHGSNSVSGVKNVILELHNLNVFCVDWSGPGGTFYTQARTYVNPVGDMIGDFINDLIDHYDVDPTTLHLMGHSLGGQLIGRIGFATGGRLGTIVALDPAWPMFPLDNTDDRLDTSDAQYVQLIHVNSGFLGYPYSVGHADFHPNGGVKQPGCGPDIIGTCAHYLIKDMIKETYTAAFTGVQCDSFANYQDGVCAGNAEAYFGGWPVDTAASGDYYLETNGAPPFVIDS